MKTVEIGYQLSDKFRGILPPSIHLLIFFTPSSSFNEPQVILKLRQPSWGLNLFFGFLLSIWPKFIPLLLFLKQLEY